MNKKVVKILIILICFFAFSNVTALADSEAIFNVDGPKTIKKGEKIEYKISIKDLVKLYAGSIDIKFNNKNIIFTKITAGDLIKKDGMNKMEFGGMPNSDNNKISYQFTCVGTVDGFTGEGILATVTAEAIQDSEINFNDSLEIKIYTRTEANDIVDIKYSYAKTDVISAMDSNKVSEKLKNSVSSVSSVSSESSESSESSGEVSVGSTSTSTDGDEEITNKDNVNDDSTTTTEDDKDISKDSVSNNDSSSVAESKSAEDKTNLLVIVAVAIVAALVVTGTWIKLRKRQSSKKVS